MPGGLDPRENVRDRQELVKRKEERSIMNMIQSMNIRDLMNFIFSIKEKGSKERSLAKKFILKMLLEAFGKKCSNGMSAQTAADINSAVNGPELVGEGPKSSAGNAAMASVK